MKLFKNVLAQVLFAVITFLGAGSLSAQENDPVGLILSTSGSVSAEADSGEIRQLRRRSPVFQGDTIITSTRSRAQIRFNDNGLVALQPQTRFVIEQHQFKGDEDGSENAVYRLLRGGIQAITGLIGNRNKDRYRFETPLATIGLRGTHWSATFCDTNCGDLDPGLYGGVAEGGIDVCNAGGCEAIDKDDYFFVADEFTAPQKIIDPPGVIFGDSTDREESEDESGRVDAPNLGGALVEPIVEVLGPDVLVEDIINNFTEEPESQDVNGSANDLGNDDGGNGGGDGGSEELDRDMDGVSDINDVFPDDPTETADTDMDGTGDNADVFPEDPREIADTDMDGTGDNADVFPEDPSEIADTDFDNIGDNADPYPLYVTADAPSDAGVVFAGTKESSVSDVIDISGLRAELTLSDSVTAVLGQVDDVDNVLLSVTDTGGCSPSCEITVIEGELLESDGIADFAGLGFGVNWGRWQLTDSQIIENGVEEETLSSSLHYAYSDNVMDEDELNSFIASQTAPVIGLYSLEAGTSPTDLAGNLGTLNSVTAAVDFFTQSVNEFSIDLDINESNYQLDLLEETSIYEGAIVLVGYVDGITEDFTAHGEAGFFFVGDQAEGALGSYNLNEIASGFDLSQEFTAITPTDIVSGVYLLGQDSLEINPAYFDRDIANTAPETGFAINSAVVTRDSLDSQAISFSAVTDSGHTINSNIVDGVSAIVGTAVIDTETDFDDSTFTIDCDPCLDINQGLLVESGEVVGPMNTIRFGRWNSLDSAAEFYDSSGAGAVSLNVGDSVHYLSSDNFGSGFSPGIGRIAIYSNIDGTSPTDEMGRSGTTNSITAQLDFYSQVITDFSLSVDVEDRAYLAFLDSEAETVSFADGIGDFDLIGSCSGGDCNSNTDLEGQSSFAIVGVDNDYFAGGYGLSSLGHDIDNSVASTSPFISVNGVYVLESNGLEANPDFFDVNVNSIDLAPLDSAAVFAFSIACTECSESVTAFAGSILSGGDDDFTTVDLGGGRNNLVVSAQENATGLFNVNDGVLVEYDSYTFVSSGSTASWGRWFSLDSSFADADSTPLNDIHFGYQDSLYTGTSNVSDVFISYSLIGGTSPTDENGVVGTLNNADLVLDFYTSSVAGFRLDFDIGDRNYFASSDEADFFGGGSSSFESQLGSVVEIDLVGYCTGGDCDSSLVIEGDAALNFIGSDSLGFPEGVLGAYGLFSGENNALSSIATVTGSFVLEQQGDLSFDVASLSTFEGEGVASIAYIETISGGLFDAAVVADIGSDPLDSIEFVELDSFIYEGQRFLSNIETLDIVGSVNEGVVIDHGVATLGRFGNESASWGLWGGDIEIGSGDMAISTVQLLPYAYAENITSVIPSSPLTGFDTGPLANTIASYSKVGGSAFSESGQIFANFSVNMSLDLDSQELSAFDIFASEFDSSGSVVTYNAFYDTELSAPVRIDSAEFDIDLFGFYSEFDSIEMDNNSANLFGSTSVTLVGDNAEGAIGSFALAAETQEFALAGAYVLEQFVDPLWFNELNSTRTSTDGVSLGAAILDGDTDAISFSGVATEAEIFNIEGDNANSGFDTVNAVVSAEYVTDSIDGGTVPSLASVNVSEGTLSFYSSTNFVNPNSEYEAYWGRWTAYDQVNVDGSDFDTLGDSLHFAYSEDLTDVSSMSPTTIEYSSLAGGAIANNQSGDDGFINNIYMSINFGAQQIESFDIGVNIDNQLWNASLDGGPVSLAGSAISNIELSGSVTSSSTGSEIDTLTGNANTAILGPNADAVLGAYNLSGEVIDAEVVGTFLVEQAIFDITSDTSF